MSLRFALPVAMLLTPGLANARADLPAPAPVQIELTSSDPAHPLTMRIRMEGHPVSVGARPPSGAVALAGSTGTITTPAVLLIGDEATVVTLSTVASSAGAQLEVRPTTGRVERIVVAVGGTLRLQRDQANGSIIFSGDEVRTHVRPQERE